MSLIVPSNVIVKNKYTSGNEYMFESTYNKYQGYYYELNGKLYAGKTFDPFAPILVKITSKDVNKALMNPLTYVYTKISGANINQNEPSSYYFNPAAQNNDTFRYFIQKNNAYPLIIKEISKETFEQFQNNSFYISVKLSYQNRFDDNEVAKAELTMPGIKAFTDSNYAPGVTD
jgi:hypothetical protein